MPLTTRCPKCQSQRHKEMLWHIYRNDHMEFNIPYEFFGTSQVYEPDFLVRLCNGMTVILEIKGQPREYTDAEDQGGDKYGVTFCSVHRSRYSIHQPYTVQNPIPTATRRWFGVPPGYCRSPRTLVSFCLMGNEEKRLLDSTLFLVPR